MNKSKIEWCDYTFNPVIGCKHGCPYCYAKRMNDRFKFIPKWEDPQLIEERFNDRVPPMPKKRNRIAQVISPDKPVIFVGSMCDLFGRWVPNEWLFEVFDFVQSHQEALFMFLTKNHVRYIDCAEMRLFPWPNNFMLGMTITDHASLIEKKTKLTTLVLAESKRSFLSIEPLLSTVDISEIETELVIVGAQTGPGAVTPKKEWIESIEHPNIHYKDNILKYLK